MTKSGNILRRISPDELDEVLARIRTEGHSELVLLGPAVTLPESPDNWPDQSRLRPLNLRMNDSVDAGHDTLPSLTQLTSLNLWDNNLGDAGAKAIASLTQLTSLNLW